MKIVVCHGDLHAANVLIENNGSLYVVDWDTLRLAPKECDLMFIGAGIGGIWNQNRQASLFYQGYGQTEVNLQAISYYRYERIVEDIAAYFEEITKSYQSDQEKERGFNIFTEQFLPNNVVNIALNRDPGCT